MGLSHYDTLAYLRRWKRLYSSASITTDEAFDVARRLTLESMPATAGRRNRRGLLMNFAQQVLRPAVEAGYLQRMPRSTWKIAGAPELKQNDADADFVCRWWHAYGSQEVYPWQVALVGHSSITAPTEHGKAIQAGKIVARLEGKTILGKTIEVHEASRCTPGGIKKYCLTQPGARRTEKDADADFMRRWWETLATKPVYTWQLAAAVSDPRATATTDHGRAVQLGKIISRLMRSSPCRDFSVTMTRGKSGYNTYSLNKCSVQADERFWGVSGNPVRHVTVTNITRTCRSKGV